MSQGRHRAGCIRRVALSLGLGFGVNLVIAWCLSSSLLGIRPSSGSYYDRSARTGWFEFRSLGRIRLIVLSNDADNVENLPVSPLPSWTILGQRLSGRTVICEDSSGLPFKSVYCYWVEPLPGFFEGHGDLLSAMRPAGQGGGSDTLPYYFRPLGTIANSMCYGMIAYMGGVVFCHAQTCRRARKGLCVACGYSLVGIRGSCPECGTPGGSRNC